MKIELKNIKQHKSLCMEIPDTGLVLIRGKSGRGKTAIVESIADALYGLGDDLVNWESSKSSIFMEYLGIEITKNTNPNNIKAVFDDKDYHDDEALGIIHDKLGMTTEEFEASSYVKQEAKNSLLSLPPANQLKFIQKLAFGDQDPEIFKEKIKSIISKYENKLTLSETVLEKAISRESEAKTEYLRIQASVPAVPPDVNEEEKSILETEIGSLRAKIRDNELEIKGIASALNNPGYSQLESYSSSLAQKREKLVNDKNQISMLHEELAQITNPSNEISEIRKNIEKFNKKEIFDKWIESAKELRAKIFKEFPIFQDSDSVVNALKAAKDEADSLRGQCLTEYRETKANLNSMLSLQQCPNCGTKLQVVGGEIFCQNEQSLPSEESLKEKARLKEQEAEYYKKLAKRYDELIIELLSLSKSRPESIELSEDVLALGKNALESNLEKAVNVQKKIDMLSGSISRLASTVVIQESEIKALETKVADFMALPNKDGLISKKTELTDDMIASQSKLSDLQVQLNTINDLLRQKSEYDSSIKLLDSYRSSLAKAVSAVEEASQTKIAAEKKLKAAMELKNISDRAALEAVEDIIGSINSNAKYYIDQMFADDGTVITINNKHTIQSGEDRAKMSTSVFHKGSKVKKLKSLSGGERARSTLAFQLAMSDLYQSPILMLDEAFSGVDAETKSKCLELLREVATKKLVLVIEHGISENFFDHIIDL